MAVWVKRSDKVKLRDNRKVLRRDVNRVVVVAITKEDRGKTKR
jgi:hypothetical protein